MEGDLVNAAKLHKHTAVCDSNRIPTQMQVTFTFQKGISCEPRIPARARGCSSSRTSRGAMRPTQPPGEWVPGFLARVKWTGV
jgi:hypothetical protein